MAHTKDISEPRSNAGRPRYYKTPEDMQKKVDEYFKWCEGEPLYTRDGDPVMDKYGQPMIVKKHPYTLTGLNLALGFLDISSLREYEAEAEFAPILQRARNYIKRYTEERLFDRDGVNGAKFILERKFAEEYAQKMNVSIEVEDLSTLADKLRLSGDE